MSSIDVNLELLPKQQMLYAAIKFNNKDQVIGFGGARGGSKSHAIRTLALLFGLQFGIQSLIFRRYSDDLLKNHIYPMLATFPFLRDFFNKTEKVLYHPKTKNPIVKFDYAETYDEIEKVAQGTEYPLIFVDEATQITQQMIEFLFTANRDSKGLFPSKAKTILTMNPGGVGHTYIKRILIDKLHTPEEKERGFYFIQSSVWDNVFWSLRELYKQGYSAKQYYNEWTEEQRKEFTIAYSDYAKNLKALPKAKREAFLYGSWNVIEGIFFDEFMPEVHIVREKDYWDYSKLKTLNVMGGLDYGNDTALLIGAKDSEGDVIIYDELYMYKVARSVKIETTKEFLAKRYIPDIEIKGDTNMWIPDSFDVAGTNSPAMDYLNAGLNLTKVTKTTNENNIRYRVSANDEIKDLLHFEMDENGKLTRKPKIKIYERCVNLIEEISTLMTDENNPDDFDKKQKCHAFDGMKYLVLALTQQSRPKNNNTPEWFIKKMKKQQKPISVMAV